MPWRIPDERRRDQYTPRPDYYRPHPTLVAAVSGMGGARSAEVVGAAGGDPRPLRGGPPVQAELPAAGAAELLRPARGRVLPALLAAVDGHVEHPVAVRHRLDAAVRGPVRLEHAVAVAQVADLHAEVASGSHPVQGRLG